jgi:hypothetical protein
MKIDYILSASPEKELYSSYIPCFINTWRKLCPKAKVKVIYVDKEIPPELEEFKDNLILFTPYDWLNDEFVANYVRMLYASLLEGNVMCLEIDEIPDEFIYKKQITNIDDNSFVIENEIKDYEIDVNYIVANAKTYQLVFHVDNLDEIHTRLCNVFEPDIDLMYNVDLHRKHAFLRLMKARNQYNQSIVSLQ